MCHCARPGRPSALAHILFPYYVCDTSGRTLEHHHHPDHSQQWGAHNGRAIRKNARPPPCHMSS
eukprot:3357843-Prymnesium_polylepis.1